MRFKFLPFCVAALAMSWPTLSVAAKNPSPKQLMDMTASCAYVVGIAEGNNVAMRYGSADWMNILRLLEQKTGLDSEKSLDLAKAKYNKRARVMGADEAFRHMLSAARQCDKEMDVIQS